MRVKNFLASSGQVGAIADVSALVTGPTRRCPRRVWPKRVRVSEPNNDNIMSTATTSAKPRMGQVYVDLPSVRHTPKAAHATDPPPSSRKPRFSQVYVEMPPLFSARAKENRSIPFNDGSSVDASVSRKRKRADSAVVLVSDVSHPNMKERPKAKKPRSSDNPPPAVLSNHKMKADEGTSHDSGTFYCHQCNYKRDNSGELALYLVCLVVR